MLLYAAVAPCAMTGCHLQQVATTKQKTSKMVPTKQSCSTGLSMNGTNVMANWYQSSLARLHSGAQRLLRSSGAEVHTSCSCAPYQPADDRSLLLLPLLSMRSPVLGGVVHPGCGAGGPLFRATGCPPRPCAAGLLGPAREGEAGCQAVGPV